MELFAIQQVKVEQGEINAINARELHAFLESKQDFSTWIKNRIADTEALENMDFIRFHKKMEANNATMIEYLISVDLAKEFSMLERNEQGKKARRYFIEVEKAYKKGFKPISLKESLKLSLELLEKNEKLEQKNKMLELEKKINEPLVNFAKAVSNSEDSILIRDFAKILFEKNKIEMGEKRLFSFLRENGFLMSDNMPYQRYIEQGYFSISEKVIHTPKGDKLVNTTKITGKGQLYILKKIEERLVK